MKKESGPLFKATCTFHSVGCISQWSHWQLLVTVVTDLGILEGCKHSHFVPGFLQSVGIK